MIKNSKLIKKTAAASLAAMMMVQPVSAAIEIPVEEPIIVSPVGGKNVGKGIDGVSGITLSDAILKMKMVLGDTKDYENFEYSYSENGDTTIYNLNWSSSKERPDLNVSIGSDGTIYNYNSYIDYHGDNIVIPEITKNQARDIAYDFALLLNPKYASTIFKDKAVVNYNTSGSYSVVFYRYHNGLAVDGEQVSLTVTHDGQIYRMNAGNMSPNVILPEVTDNASSNMIKKAFDTAIPFQIRYYTYRPDNPDAKSEIRLHYVPNDKYSSVVIDALTGEVSDIVHEDGGNRNMMFAASASGGMVEESAADTAMKGYTLSEAEVKAVELQDSFITLEEAAAKVMALDGLALDDGIAVTSNNLTENESPFTGEIRYFYTLTFGDADGNYKGSARVDCESGEVLNFSVNANVIYKAVSEHKYNDDQCMEAAEKFLNAYYADKFSHYRIAPGVEDRVYNASQRLSTYTYSYNRYENDIIYGDDNISITVDPETLGITFFSIDYCDGEFVSPEKAISASKALDYYWTQLTPDPIYMVSSNYGEGKLTVYTGYGATKEPLDLVKVYRFDRHLYIDAFDGTLLNYSGRPYTYSEIEYFDGVGFGDIENTPYAEAISKLCDMDFIKDAAKYRPNSHITVGDFMEMIRPLNTSYYRTKVINSDNEEYDPKAEITREEAAKIVIESMGYGEVAALSGIFKCSFTDADALTDGYIGYAAIAQALGLLDSFGDTMQPRNMLTRGEAAQIVYDYLLRLNK